jgi:hypothetical protein
MAAPGVLKTVTKDLRGDGHFVSGDIDPNKSNDHLVLKASIGDVPAGQVLGKVTATGAYAPHDPAASDGTEVAAAILWGARANKAATQRAVGVFRNVVVNGNALTFKAGITTNQRDAAVAALATKGLMVRF